MKARKGPKAFEGFLIQLLERIAWWRLEWLLSLASR